VKTRLGSASDQRIRRIAAAAFAAAAAVCEVGTWPSGFAAAQRQAPERRLAEFVMVACVWWAASRLPGSFAAGPKEPTWQSGERRAAAVGSDEFSVHLGVPGSVVNGHNGIVTGGLTHRRTKRETYTGLCVIFSPADNYELGSVAISVDY
jgi:hypothetical protein